jgi:hypothetical protein
VGGGILNVLNLDAKALVLSLHVSNVQIHVFHLGAQHFIELLSHRAVLLDDKVLNCCDKAQPVAAGILDALPFGVHDQSVVVFQEVE